MRCLYANSIPILYTHAFVYLLDPMYICNRMLYDNIIIYSSYPHRLNRKEVPTFVDRDGKVGVHFSRKDVSKNSHEFLTRKEL